MGRFTTKFCVRLTAILNSNFPIARKHSTKNNEPIELRDF